VVSVECGARVRYATGSNETGGQLIAYFAITSRSARGCTLAGFPSVRLLDGHGRVLPTHPIRRRDIPIRAIEVRRGLPGEFSMIYTYATADHQRVCEPVPHAIRVRLPGQRRALIVAVNGPDPQLDVFAPCGGTFVLSPIIQ
jgi:hypothetical protein